MLRKASKTLGCFWSVLLLCLLSAPIGWAQSFNGTITGSVTDQSGALVPNAELTLTAVGTGIVRKDISGPDGLFRFPNLTIGLYNLTAAAKGFRDFEQKGISVDINQTVTANVRLVLGAAAQTIEVVANASPLNFENGERKSAVSPNVVEELPLLVSSSQRSVGSFVLLMPGVTTGTGNNPYDARINGGLQSGDEALMDGVSMFEGLQGNGGMISLFTDFPISPDTVSELSVITSNYEPQYGNTTAAVMTAVTKSGTSQFHGTAFELLRNTDLNARTYGVPTKPTDQENDFGLTIGGPIKWPKWPHTNRRAFFFFALDDYWLRGGLSSPVQSIPTMRERQGDFSDWVDSTGKLIPVYDPATTRANPNYNPSLPTGPNNLPYLRDQFMGCSGNTPNVICPSDPRLANSLAQGWYKYMPAPTFNTLLNNYVSPAMPVGGDGVLDHRELYTLKVDWYFTTKDHFSFVSYQARPIDVIVPIYRAAQLDPYYTGVTPHPSVPLDRVNWDHTFTPTLLATVNWGYYNPGGKSIATDAAYASSVPQIAGVVSNAQPSALSFQNFSAIGADDLDRNVKSGNVTNELTTWVHGTHTVKFGGEIRKSQYSEMDLDGLSGSFYFSQLNTGLLGMNSGSDIASFLLGQVSSASDYVPTVGSYYMRNSGEDLFVGDTWKVKPRLSLSYGLRWDMSKPDVERYNHLSVFDPLMPNPEAGNLLGALAFAGSQWGAASLGRRSPEYTWKKGFAPRLGFAFTLNPKTVARGGYGIFYTNMFYPNWGGGESLDGFNATPSFSSSQGGMTAAFNLNDGFPQNFSHPPFIDPGFDNGQSGPLFRGFDSNRLPYTQQWNITVERQFTNNFYIDAAYVGNKGTRLPSVTDPLNALNPSLLSMGQKLNDTFQAGMTSLDGVPVPYPGWINQMTGCAPTVAQALMPYPQYCGSLTSLTENAGNSTYHAFQLKAEKRMANGLWFLASYAASKLISDGNNVQAAAETWAGVEGAISPYERQRNKAISDDDVPQALTLTLVYQLPVGAGKRFLNKGGVVNKVAGGWQFESIYRATSGVPFPFRSSNCDVPGQFQSACIPSITGNPWAQSKSHFNPNLPLFNASAFQNSGPEGFQFNTGSGATYSNLRGFAFHNQDIAIFKNTQISERVGVQFRAEFFDAWNWHGYGCQTQCYGDTAFNTNIASPGFGMWDGEATVPRNVQLGLKLIW